MGFQGVESVLVELVSSSFVDQSLVAVVWDDLKVSLNM